MLLFDLDGTLYPTSNGYVTHVRKNLYEYMENTLQIPEAEKAWLPLFQKYNQTLRGLKCSGYDVNVDEYWATTRQGAEGFIAAAPAELVDLLRALPQKKYVLTNCNELEAKVINMITTEHCIVCLYPHTSCKTDLIYSIALNFVTTFTYQGSAGRNTKLSAMYALLICSIFWSCLV